MDIMLAVTYCSSEFVKAHLLTVPTTEKQILASIKLIMECKQSLFWLFAEYFTQTILQNLKVICPVSKILVFTVHGDQVVSEDGPDFFNWESRY